MLKRILIVLFICNIMLLTGCHNDCCDVPQEFEQKSYNDILGFMLKNIYIKDIPDVITNETKDEMYYSFKIQNNIKVESNYNKSKFSTEAIITADKDANIDDIVNCIMFALTDKKVTDEIVCKDTIEKAIENKGTKIKFPVDNESFLSNKKSYIEYDSDSNSIYVYVVMGGLADYSAHLKVAGSIVLFRHHLEVG